MKNIKFYTLDELKKEYEVIKENDNVIVLLKSGDIEMVLSFNDMELLGKTIECEMTTQSRGYAIIKADLIIENRLVKDVFKVIDLRTVKAINN